MTTQVDSSFNYKLKMNVVKLCKHNPMLSFANCKQETKNKKKLMKQKKKHKHCCVVRSKNIIKETKAM
jgi:hypothetical protein